LTAHLLAPLENISRQDLPVFAIILEHRTAVY